ncbi:hypothetical protein K1719_044034 [Acacia pycnantha]|nr:hypothetical protein K1719_044034 [Acacia pycnantha]
MTEKTTLTAIKTRAGKNGSFLRRLNEAKEVGLRFLSGLTPFPFPSVTEVGPIHTVKPLTVLIFEPGQDHRPLRGAVSSSPSLSSAAATIRQGYFGTLSVASCELSHIRTSK